MATPAHAGFGNGDDQPGAPGGREGGASEALRHAAGSSSRDAPAVAGREPGLWTREATAGHPPQVGHRRSRREKMAGKVHGPAPADDGAGPGAPRGPALNGTGEAEAGGTPGSPLLLWHEDRPGAGGGLQGEGADPPPGGTRPRVPEKGAPDAPRSRGLAGDGIPSTSGGAAPAEAAADSGADAKGRHSTDPPPAPADSSGAGAGPGQGKPGADPDGDRILELAQELLGGEWIPIEGEWRWPSAT